jgi:GAF domain-containing protein
VLGTRDRMHGLLEAVVAIGSGLELEAMLRRIVEAAVDLVDARYGALGVIGEDQRLIEFIPVGLGTEEISEIHHWPAGRGLLGLLIREPRPLRLADIGAHRESSGFPAGHPAMRSFVGVPVRASIPCGSGSLVPFSLATVSRVADATNHRPVPA